MVVAGPQRSSADRDPSLSPVEARPGSTAEHVGVRLARHGHHPAAATVEVAAVAYTVLTAAMLLLGTAINHWWVPSSLGHWDDSVSRWMSEHRTPWLTAVTGVATFLANTAPVVGLAVVGAIVFMVLRQWRATVLLLVALPLELAVFLSTTYLVGRPRPNVPRLDSTPGTASFPSGHIAASLVLWGAVAIALAVCSAPRVLQIVAWCWAVLISAGIGFARVYRGMHHLTDVIAGGLLGVAVLCAGVLAVRATSAAVEARAGRRRAPLVHSLGVPA
jgi:undecaprenyl-diphosphatase